MLTTSAAEVLVCWSALATTVAALRPSFRPAHARMLAVVPGSLLFGVYHVAHSPPFDSSPMIALLTGVRVATGLVFALTGDVHGAILFHSFLALFGVLRRSTAPEARPPMRSWRHRWRRRRPSRCS